MVQANGILNAISKRLGKHRLFYVCRDVERALGLDLKKIHNYFIISNSTGFARKVAKDRPNIILIKAKNQLDTRDLLQHKTAKQAIKRGDFVVVFKNTTQIEKLCAQNGWTLINPPAEISGRVEEKISQVKWLGDLTKYLPKQKIQLCKDIKSRWSPFIVQFNRSHTGSGTMLIDSKEKLTEIKNKFPLREARVADYIKGPMFTNNNVVWGDKVFLGNINYQITGLSPFTENPFATIGNDWQLPYKILNKKQIKQYQKIAADVGRKLKKSGWKGLFGIDVIAEEKTGKLYLIEVNARQPASTTYESVLQNKNKNSNSISTFAAHLAGLLDISPNGYKLAEIKNGAQIIQRMSERIDAMAIPKIKNVPTNIIVYENKKIGEDLVRIQSEKGIMEKHNVFNADGLAILVGVMFAQKQVRWTAKRSGAILIKDGKILLMKRNKYGNKYYSMPGGTVEKNENLKDTAKREILEETGLHFQFDAKKPLRILTHRDEYYFFTKDIVGEEALGGPEKARNAPDNYYELEWVDLKKLPAVRLLPESLKKKLIASLN
ncbi:MAG: NUDIX domain-containing protein [Patescibacteria group bacterium]